MKKYLLLASVAGCLMASNAMADVADDAQSATLTASVTLKSAHVLGGTTAINFGTLMLKRDQIPTNGSAVQIANLDIALHPVDTYVQATSGDTSVANMTIDGLKDSDDAWDNLGDINLTATCNTTYVAGKGCKISGTNDDLEVYLDNSLGETFTTPVDEITNNEAMSSLFDSRGMITNLKVATTNANWSDVELTDVSAYTITMQY